MKKGLSYQMYERMGEIRPELMKGFQNSIEPPRLPVCIPKDLCYRKE